MNETKIIPFPRRSTGPLPQASEEGSSIESDETLRSSGASATVLSGSSGTLPAEGSSTPAQSGPPATRPYLYRFLPDGPVAAMLASAGHSRSCIMRLLTGLRMSCSCGADSEPVDEAAQAVGRAIRFARMAATRQVPIPRGVITALIEQVDAGNAAAILVWQWLARRGQIPAGCGLRPRLRLVCERS